MQCVEITMSGIYSSVFVQKSHSCTEKNHRFCPTSAEIGLRYVDGAFADYSLIDAKYTVKIPEEMSFEQAAPMSCAGVTIYHSIKRCGLKPGQVS